MSGETERNEIINATCPECRGPLTKVGHDHVHEYECLVGHKYSARALLTAHADAEERALWSAVVALEEASNLVRAAEQDFPPEVVQRLMLQAERKQGQAAEVRRILEQLEPFDPDSG